MKKLCFIFLLFILNAKVFAQAPGASCAAAVAIGGTGAIGNCSGSVTVSDVTSDGTVPSCLTGVYRRDGWYSFINPSTQNITVTATSTTATSNLIIQIFSGICASLVEVGCVNAITTNSAQTEAISVNIAAGTYYIKLTNYSSTTAANMVLSNVCVNLTPSNDNCASSTVLTPGASSVSCSLTAGTILGATSQATIPATCTGANTNNDDVWYSFTATSTTHMITVTPSASMDAVLQVYSSNPCGGAGTSIDCRNYTGAGTNEADTLTGLTIANTYWIRVYDSGTGISASSTFDICIQTPPTNDNCAGAIVLTPSATCNNVAGNVFLATQTLAGCSGTANDDVWYTFTTTATANQSYSITVTGSANFNAVIQVFSGSCGGTSINCVNATGIGSIETITLTAGVQLSVSTQYWIRVYDAGIGYPASSTFNICIQTGTSRYWVGGTNTWDATPGTKWAYTSGGVGGAPVPTSAEDVYFDANSGAGIITASTAPEFKSLNCTGFTGSLNSNGFACDGSFILNSAMTFSLTGELWINNTNNITDTALFTSAGKSFSYNINISNYMAGIKLTDDLNSTAALNFWNGYFDANNHNVTVDSFVTTSNAFKTLKMGSGTWTINGTGNAFNLTGAIANNIIIPGTSTIKLTGNSSSAISFVGQGKTYHNLWDATSGSGALTISGSNTFSDFKIDAGRAVKFTTGTTTSVSTFTANGTSGNLITLNSTTTGTHTLVKTGGGIINCDYINIQHSVAAPASTWYAGIHSIDNQAVTTAGSGWNFPTDRYWVGGTNTWDATAGTKWAYTSGGTGGAPVPTLTDNVFIDANSGNVTVTLGSNVFCNNLNFTGFSGTFIEAGTMINVYGNLTLASAMTYTGAGTLSFNATSSGKTITTNGKTIPGDYVQFGGVGGSYTLQDNLITTGTAYFGEGTFNANNFNFTANDFYFHPNNTNDVVITMGSGTWEATGDDTNAYLYPWALEGQALGGAIIINAGTSTVKFTNTSSNSKTFGFAGGITGGIYNNFWYSPGAGTGALIVQGTNTFADFKDSGTSAHNINFTTGTTQTVSTFTASGTSGNLITINSTTTGTHTLVKAGGGTINCDYLNLQHSIATPPSTWFAGAHSINNQGVATAGSGWVFPVTSSINSHTDVSCNGGNNGSATVTASQGILPYTYSWAPNGGTSATATNLTANTYTCTVTDSVGEVSSATVIIAAPAAIASSQSPSICAGQTITVGASTYNATGTYTDIFTAYNGCDSTVTTNLTVNSLPTIIANTTATSVCSGNSVTLTGSGATSYVWTGGVTDGVGFIPGSTSTYTVSGTDGNGCQNTSTTTVTVNNTPATPGAISGTTTICSGTINTYTITAVGGATSYTWTLPGGWTGTSTTNSINATASGTSGNITVTANNTCGNSSAQTQAITVNTIPATPGAISGTTTICSGTSNIYTITAVGGATSYTWTLPGGWTGTSTTNSINATASGTSGNITVTANNTCGNSSAQTQAITVNTVPATPGAISGTTTICSGTINTYTITAVGGATSYTWTLPGGWTGTSTTNSINATASGTSGNVTVTANNACGSSSVQTQAITVNTIPATPGAISGTTTICSGTSNTYTITAVGGATSYTWTLQGGWTGTSTTNSITATASSASGNITVTANNTCGNSSAQTQAITVNTIPATPGAISGTTTICSGTSNIYTITAVGGATSYTWTLPGGWTGTSTTNSITATASSASGNITVTANNTCGNSSAQTQAITVNTIPATPGAISGTTTICSGTINTYTITAVGGATSYTWTLPGGWTGTSTTNSINTTASSTSGNITVTADNACGSSSAQTQAITVNTIPATPGLISGTTTICSGTNNTYNITAVAGATSYTWTLPGGWTGTSTTNSINATASSTSGNITVTANNTCGNSSAQIQTITVNTAPATPGAISGTTTICSGTSNTYNITAVGGATSYTWTLPGGWTGSSTTNSINATASSTSGNITVTANNACGSSSAQTQAITVNTIPATPGLISGTTTICSGTSNAYNITAVGGATSYTWTLPGGWTGSSTTNSINATASITSGNITVTANNACGSSSAQTQAITVNTIPVTPGAISGTTTICSGTSNTYTITAVSGATSYTWTLPGGWTGTSTTNSINATASSTSGNITVTANNACGSSSAQTQAITVNTIPATPGAISGTTTICSGTSNTYTITSVGGATSYTWTLPGGWTGTSTTNSINTTASNTSGNISVTADNTCGNSSAQTQGIIVNTLPNVTANATANTLCAGGLDTVTGGGAISYIWTGGVTDGIGFIPVSTATYTVTGTDGNGCQNTAVATITVNSIPTITVNSVTICPGLTAGLIANGGTTYSWSAGATPTGVNTADVTPGATSTYTVTGTTNGCSDTAVATVTIGTTLTITVNSPSICTGQTAGLIAGGGTTYVWSSGVNSTGTNTADATPISTTSYTVTGTTSGCSGTAVSTVTVNSIPTITVNSTTICSGQTANLTANGGTAYSWSVGATSTGINTADASPLTTSTYTVIGTTLGCSDSAFSTVTVNMLPNVTASASAGALCFGASDTLTGGGATSYLWTGGVADGVGFVPSATTSYTVTGTDGNVCQNTAVTTITVNSLPNITANASSTTVCLGAYDTLTGGGGNSYVWSGGVTDGVGFVPATTATYTVTGTDLNGCQNTASSTITVNSIPAITVNSPTICSGQTASLTANGGTTYSWSAGVTSTGINTADASPVSTTSYTVTGTTNGCSDTASSVVTVNSLPVITVNSPTICAGQTANLIANGGTTYSWSAGANVTGVNTANATPVITTSYTVTGTTNSCSDSAISVITVNNATTGSQTFNICSGGTITVGTNTYNTTGVYSDTLVGFTSCDSILTTNLTVSTTITTSQTQVICVGSYLYVGIHQYFNSGVYIDTLSAIGGCDSVLTTNLNVNPVLSVQSITDSTMCQHDSVFLAGTATGGTQPYNYIWNDGANTYNNDSLLVFPTINSTYTLSVTDSLSCSSAYIVHLTINPNTNLSGYVTYGGVPVHGNVALFKWQPIHMRFDSIPNMDLDVNGYYHFDTISHDKYIIKVFPDNAFYPAQKLITSYFNDTASVDIWDRASVIQHGCSTSTDSVNVSMFAEDTIVVGTIGNIRGKITEGQHYYRNPTQPVSGVEIKLGHGGRTIQNTTSDSTGYYYFDSIPAGEYTIRADVPGLLRDSVYTVTLSPVDNSFLFLDYIVDSADIYMPGCVAVQEIVTQIPGNYLSVNTHGIGVSYQWLDCGNAMDSIPGADSATFQPPYLPGNYAVVVSHIGCIDTSNCLAYIPEVVSNYKDNSDFTIQPNPFNSQTLITFNQEQKHTTIKITDILGKEIKKITLTGTKSQIIERGNMDAGIYFVQITDVIGNRTAKKLIVE